MTANWVTAAGLITVAIAYAAVSAGYYVDGRGALSICYVLLALAQIAMLWA